MKTGPNVKKLICHKMALLMVPPNSQNALQTALAALTKQGNLAAIGREATAWTEAALAAVKAAPGNPFGDDDEAIAGEILRQVEARLRAGRPGQGLPSRAPGVSDGNSGASQ